MPAEPDAAAYRAAISHFATGVTVVTTAGPAGMTANAICSLSLDPLLMLVCLELSSRTLAAVRESGRLAVNVLAQHQQPLASVFASKAPEPEKFLGVGFDEVDGVPVLHEVGGLAHGRRAGPAAGGRPPHRRDCGEERWLARRRAARVLQERLPLAWRVEKGPDKLPARAVST